MKKFLISFSKWLVPVLLLCYPLDYFLSYELKKSKEYAQDEFSVWNDLYEGKINSEVVIYGSSRAWVHISSQMMEDGLGKTVYNMGIDGHNFWLQKLRHQLLMEHNRKPEVIVFSLDLFTLQKKKELYNADQFLPYLLCNSELKTYLDTYQGYEFYDYYLPLVRYYGKRSALYSSISNFIQPAHPDSGRKKGYKGMDEEWNTDFDEAVSKMNAYRSELDNASITLFDSFIASCRRDNIKVIFVYTPEFIKGQQFVSNREAVIRLYRNFATKYDCLFFDYSNDEICFDQGNFYNASHMKKQAAEKFTGKLINDIIASGIMRDYVVLNQNGNQQASSNDNRN